MEVENRNVRVSERAPVVFFLDVDNTLLDNDRIVSDLKEYLSNQIGPDREARYWEILEGLRTDLGYADYLGALQRYRVEQPYEPHLLALASYFVNYPFAGRLFPGASDVVAYLARCGSTVILSDGDAVFQPLKIERSGLFSAVEGRVLIYIHKEQEVEDIARRYPANHYVLVDDKIRILTAMKRIWGNRLTTIFPRQGHFAHEEAVSGYPPADITIERIAELADYDLRALIGAAEGSRGTTNRV